MLSSVSRCGRRHIDRLVDSRLIHPSDVPVDPADERLVVSARWTSTNGAAMADASTVAVTRAQERSFEWASDVLIVVLNPFAEYADEPVEEEAV